MDQDGKSILNYSFDTKYGNEDLGHEIILDYEEKRYDNKGVLNSIESYCSQIGILETYKDYK